MRYSLLGGIVGPLTGFILAILYGIEGLLPVLISPVIAGILSGFDRLLHRILGLVIFYLIWFVTLLIHTILFSSSALLAFAGILFFSPYIIPIYLIAGYITSKVSARKRGS